MSVDALFLACKIAFCTIPQIVPLAKGANTASGVAASVSGGTQNTAGGFVTVVIGGGGVIDNNNRSIAPQPPF